MNNHPFHLVDKSPWPIVSSMALLCLTSGAVVMFYNTEYYLITIGIVVTIMCMIQWWRDIIRESTFQGLHSIKVVKNMKLGMILFILSEIMFFVAFFWSFFHSSLSPSIEIGMNWPPLNIKSFNPMGIPLLNTMILLSSGVSMTWAHSALLMKNYTQSMKSMTITIILGIYFSMLQLYEYLESPFCIADSVYGSSFFMSTGFHGIHVLVGSIFILISIIRLKKLHYSNYHHVGFECSAWYWHFVDVVWLFLYVSIYWWGS
uniref:Cytochrome c oxidase subunit 3 n=1 Tax=Nondenticentrus paramelanicus TaxID=3065213 RepID=A0AA95T3C5_9HEMI|nr:cytochrome c oxidase subunit III [Nondenticentrus paramelanicus]WKZ08089.1 cytochrome c oxidase subunit III [Nondenticentrus paramelanicus]